MSILADTGAVVYKGTNPKLDDPAIYLAGFPATDAVLSSRKSNFTPSTLGQTIKVYTSGQKNSVRLLADFYASLGATYEIEEGPIYKLTVTLPYDELTDVDTVPLNWAIWEIVPNQTTKSIYQTGIFSPTTKGGTLSSDRKILTNTQKIAVEKSIENLTYSPNLTATGDPTDAANQYIAQNYLALRRLGVDGMMAFTQTVKRTVIVNKKSTQIIDPSGVSYLYGNTVICGADLINLYSIPSTISPYIIGGYGRSVTNTNSDGVTLAALGGYIIKPPTYQLISPNKISQVTEFVFDEWLDSLYKPLNGDYSKFVNTPPTS